MADHGVRSVVCRCISTVGPACRFPRDVSDGPRHDRQGSTSVSLTDPRHFVQIFACGRVLSAVISAGDWRGASDALYRVGRRAHHLFTVAAARRAGIVSRIAPMGSASEIAATRTSFKVSPYCRAAKELFVISALPGPSSTGQFSSGVPQGRQRKAKGPANGGPLLSLMSAGGGRSPRVPRLAMPPSY